LPHKAPCRQVKRRSAAYAKQHIRDKLIEHREYITARGEDLPAIRNWKWAR
jgi:xylulose-5-phosphate/fructose-6-phosphate phosphoketolase